MSTNLTTAEHLSSLASAVKGKLNVLDTLPATVNGGLWLEGGGSVPIIKMYYGGNAFKITPELGLLDPQLTLSETSLTVPLSHDITFTVSYLGGGEITLSDDYGGTYSYDSNTKTVTVAGTPGGSSGTITVSLSAAGDYAAATATIAVQISSSMTPDVPVPDPVDIPVPTEG